MARKPFPLSKVYGLLDPVPVVMLTTSCVGHSNIMTRSWHTMMEFEPPLVGCIISDRNHSFGMLMATNECVINIPTAEIAEKVVGCEKTSGANIDKVKCLASYPNLLRNSAHRSSRSALQTSNAGWVDTSMVDRYCLFILEVIKAWIDSAMKNPLTIHHLGSGNFMVAGKKIKLKSKMKSR